MKKVTVLNFLVTLSPGSRPFLQLHKRTVGDSNSRKQSVIMKQSEGTNVSVDIVACTSGDGKVYIGSSFAYPVKLSHASMTS